MFGLYCEFLNLTAGRKLQMVERRRQLSNRLISMETSSASLSSVQSSSSGDDTSKVKGGNHITCANLTHDLRVYPFCKALISHLLAYKSATPLIMRRCHTATFAC